MKIKRMVLWALSLVLLFTMIPSLSAIVWAEDGEGSPAISIGAGNIEKGNKVYMGVRIIDNSIIPISWLVLGSANSTDLQNDDEVPVDSRNARLLITEKIQDNVPFNSEGNSNVWQWSEIQLWCKDEFLNDGGYYDGQWQDNFSLQEKVAMLCTSKEDAEYSDVGNHVYGESALENDQVFLLSAEEVSDDYGYFSGDESRAAYKYDANEPWSWWLRSPNCLTIYGNDAAWVQPEGGMGSYLESYLEGGVNAVRGARPAFNIDRDKVLFTSPAVDGKSFDVLDLGALSAVPDVNTSEWKMTLYDYDRAGFEASAATGAVLSQEEGYTSWSVPVVFSNAYIENDNDCVSVILADSNDNALYYGDIAYQTASSDAGQEVIIPEGLTAGHYKLYVFSEQVNEDKLSDYASQFETINLTVGAPQAETFTVIFKAEGGTWTDGTTADKEVTVEMGSAAAAPEEPTREGFTFDGWDNDFSYVISDLTVKAKWKSTWTWLQSQLDSADSGSVIRLDRDIIWQQGDPAPLTLDRSGVELTLDLNGYTINRGLEEAVDEGNVLTISAGSLTLKDSSASGDDPGTGLITGGNSSDRGGGVYVNTRGSFILESGTISGNTAGIGGGVFVSKNSEFTMSGGTISGNTVTGYYGGGVHVDGSFTMSGGTVSGNSAGMGGGVYVSDSGSFMISGDPLITGNPNPFDPELQSNVYAAGSNNVIVTGKLTGGGGSIGAALFYKTGKFAGGTDEYTLSDSDRAVFSSDDPKMGVFLKEDNAVYLLYPLSIEGVSAENKVYDGTTAAGIQGTPVLNGVQQLYPVTLVTDSAAAAFADADAGQGKTVSFSGYSLSGDDTDKYHLAQPPDVRADITQRPLAVTAESGQGKTFGAADPALMYTQEGLIGGDTISGTLARAEGEDAGTYAITLGTLSAGNNYAITYTGADFTISKAAARTLADVTLSQFCNAASVSASLSGKMPADAGTLSYTPGTPVVSGSQKTGVSGFTVNGNGAVSASITNGERNVTITLPVVIASANYEDSTVNVVVTLLPVYDVTVIPGAGMTKTADSGAESQTELTGAMTPVVYTADDGYYFPENYSVEPVSGISVTRNSWTQITVSGTPDGEVEITLTAASAKVKESTPSAVFTASGPDSGTLTNVKKGLKYSLDGGSSWKNITETSVKLGSGVTAAKGIKVYQPASDANTRLDSDVQTITVKQAAKPTASAAVGCTTINNNNGRLTGVAKTMEYRKSDASSWTAGTGKTISGLIPGTYYVRVKAAGAVLASENQTLKIAAYTKPAVTGVKIRNSAGEDISGKTVTVYSASVQLSAAATPKGASQKFTWKSSDTTAASVDSSGKVSFSKAGIVTIRAAATDGSKKSANVKIVYVPKLTIKDLNVRGYDCGIRIRIPYAEDVTGYVVKEVYDVAGKKTVKPRVKITDSKTYTTILLSGSALTYGKVYRVKIYRYQTFDGKKYSSNTVTKYAVPNVVMKNVTAVPGDKSVVLNLKYNGKADGLEYRINRVSTGKQVEKQVISGTQKKVTVRGLINGELYYASAVPFTEYNGKKLYRLDNRWAYFVPLSKPAETAVKFSGSTTAVASMKKDSAATGIRVLYRTVGGTLLNGCEARGTQCTITGLNKSTAYEFYLMKYKTVNGTNHYGPGVVVLHKAKESGLSAPSKVLVESNDTATTFTITKASAASGISVLYREEKGNFKPACEKDAASCSKKLDTGKKYSYYIMQYRLVSGKKVYSPGITVKNWIGTKDASGLTADYTVVNEAVDPELLRDALADYYTEEDLLRDEAYQLLEGAPMALTGTSEEDPDEAEGMPAKGPEPDGQLTGSEVRDLTRPETGQDAFAALMGTAELPATGFSSRHTTVLSEQPEDLNYQPLRMRLQIPSLKLETDLVTVPLAQDAWQVKWLGSRAGVLDGSALPGEGYSVVAAHNTLSDTEYGPFALLGTLEVNDAVMVSEPNGKVKLFRVYASELLDPDDTEKLVSVAEREANSLVLLTCENETAEGGYLNRRAVFAKFISAY